MGCILAIDHGTKKTCFAVADALRIVTEPLDVLHAGGDSTTLIAHIIKLCTERDVERLLIGLPRNMDDSEGPRAENVRAFGARIEAALQATRLRVPEVTFWDERLTTKEADALLVDAGYTGAKRKERRDSWGALVILRDWLETNE